MAQLISIDYFAIGKHGILNEIFVIISKFNIGILAFRESSILKFSTQIHVTRTSDTLYGETISVFGRNINIKIIDNVGWHFIVDTRTA